LNHFTALSWLGMARFSSRPPWVGLGVIADNLINIGRVMEQTAEP
jgi:hypothetical protein